MIALTKKYLEQVCVSSLMPNSDLVARLQARSVAAYNKLQQYIPESLLQTLPVVEDPADVSDDPDREMYRACASYIAAQTYLDSLDDLNLVLTPTGFGVVSNQNVAPASMERINALRVSLDQKASDYMTRALELLRQRDDVPAQYLWRFRESLIWAPGQIAPLVESRRPTWDDLETVRPKLAEAEAKLKVLISPEQYEATLDRYAHNKCTEADNLLMAHSVAFVLNYAKSQPVGYIIKNLVSILEVNITNFPEYQSSATYAAAHRTTYENQKEAPGYFFHM